MHCSEVRYNNNSKGMVTFVIKNKIKMIKVYNNTNYSIAWQVF